MPEAIKMKFESENMKFKRQLTDDIYKEVVAFANTDGGVFLICSIQRIGSGQETGQAL